MKSKNVIVQETKDYSRFAAHPSNPSSRKASIALIESMKQHGFLAGFPITVQPQNGRLTIIEGHRRFDAAQKLGIPVRYVIDSTSDIDPMFISTLAQRWTVAQRVESYAQQGNTHYKLLMDWCELFSVTTAAVILSGKCDPQELISGNFKATQSPERAEKLCDIMHAIRGYHEKPLVTWWNRQRLALALSWIFRHVPNFKPDQMIARIIAHRSLMDIQPTAMHFVRMLENVYNRFCRGPKEPIYTLVQQGNEAARAENARKAASYSRH